MAEKFSTFLTDDPSVTAVPLPVAADDRLAIVRGTAPNAVAYYVEAGSLAGGSPIFAATSDGVSNASGGSIGTGSNQVTGSGFVDGDVGKVLGIYGAGASFYVSTIALATAGSDYNVNDLITAAGGTFTVPVVVRVTAAGVLTTGDITISTATILNVADVTGLAAGQKIVATGLPADVEILSIVGSTVTMSKNATATTVGVSVQFWTGLGTIFDFDLINPGIYSVTTSPLTQGSTTHSAPGDGSGTGATFTTAAWVNTPLVGTITQVVDSTTVLLDVTAAATVSSVAYAYGTDNTTAVQTAVDAGAAAILGPGICIHTAPIEMPDTGVLYGQGIGAGTTSVGTDLSVLLYLGPPMADAQIRVSNVSGVSLGGAGICLDGFFLAAQGLFLGDTTFGNIGRLKTLRHAQVGMVTQATPGGGTSNWQIDHLSILENEAYGLNACGLWTGYPNNADTGTDTNQFVFTDVRINIETTVGKLGVPWQGGAMDHNTVVFGRFRGPTANPGFEALGSNWVIHPHGDCNQTIFLSVDTGEGGYVGRAVGFDDPSGPNHIFFYDQANGSPAAVLEQGAFLRSTQSDGLAIYQGLLQTNMYRLQQTPHNSTFMIYVNNAPHNQIGATFTTTDVAGHFEVIVVWDGTASAWRVIASVIDSGRPTYIAKRSNSVLTRTNSTVFTAIPDTAFTVVDGKTYNITGFLSGTAGAGGGIKFRLAPGGAISASSVRLSATTWNGTTPIRYTNVTNLTTDLGDITGVYTHMTFEGSITLGATGGGTITPSAAQNAADAAATTVAAGSWITLNMVN